MGMTWLQPPMPHGTAEYTLIPVLGDRKRGEILWRKGKSYDCLKEGIGPLFDEPFEHVTVLYEGERRDMFVGETSAINGRHIRNIRATAIYRSLTLAQFPHHDPEGMPAISGPAVIFDKQVWY